MPPGAPHFPYSPLHTVARPRASPLTPPYVAQGLRAIGMSVQPLTYLSTPCASPLTPPWVEQVLDAFDELQAAGLSPLETHYRVAISACASLGDGPRAAALLHRMQQA